MKSYVKPVFWAQNVVVLSLHTFVIYLGLLFLLSFLFLHITYFQLAGEMGPDFGAKMTVKSLTSQQIVRIHQLFRQAKFDDPSGNVCISFHLVRLSLLSCLFATSSFTNMQFSDHSIETNQFYSVLVLQVNTIYV